MSAFIYGLFSIVNTIVLHDLQLDESVDAVTYIEEPQIRRNCIYGGPTISYIWIFNFV